MAGTMRCFAKKCAAISANWTSNRASLTSLDCGVEIVQLGSLSLGAARGSSGRFLRSRAMLSDGCDDFVLITALANKVVAEQNGSSVELRQSEMCLLEMNAYGGVGFDFGDHFTAIRIPRRELLSLCPVAEDILMKPLQQEPGIRTLIQRYQSLSAAAADSLDPEAQQVTARHMVDLIALLLRSGDDDARLTLQGGSAAARLQLIQSQVTANLHDPSLSIACCRTQQPQPEAGAAVVRADRHDVR